MKTAEDVCSPEFRAGQARLRESIRQQFRYDAAEAFYQYRLELGRRLPSVACGACTSNVECVDNILTTPCPLGLKGGNMPDAVLEDWNRRLPIGMLVEYYPILGQPEHITGKVRSEVWELCGRYVVLIEGKAGGVDVRHLEVAV